MDKSELTNILNAHKAWWNDEPDGERANLSGANLSGADLSGADLSGAVLSRAVLSGADLSGADLRSADLRNTDLSGADLRNADLSGADLSGADLSGADLSGADLSGAVLSRAVLSRAKGLLSATAFMAENFETTADGYIAYKAFGRQYASPDAWKIEPGAIIDEVPNPDRCTECACGINVAPLKWVREYAGGGSFWKVLIRWAWLPGVVVPYMTDGKIRCERVELIEMVGTTR